MLWWCLHKWREKERVKIRTLSYDAWTGKRNEALDGEFTKIILECVKCGELKSFRP